MTCYHRILAERRQKQSNDNRDDDDALHNDYGFSVKHPTQFE